VGALVQSIRPDAVVVRLVNLSPTHRRELTIQAGAYGEHQFKAVTYPQQGSGLAQTVTLPLDSPHLAVDLLPGAEITLELRLERLVNDPSYRLPWD
jgi:hypothetical protein